MMPFDLIDWASSARRASSNTRRGWSGFGAMSLGETHKGWSFGTAGAAGPAGTGGAAGAVGECAGGAVGFRVGSSAPMPFPKALRGLSGFCMVQDLFRELDIAFSAAR